MSHTEDPLLSATAHAVAHARRRGSDEVTAEDLLLGALRAAARLGVASLGPLRIDLSAVDGGSPAGSTSHLRPRYAPDAAATFERASTIARADGEPRVRLVHLLAALGDADTPLMRDLGRRYDFDGVEWRAALAQWDERERHHPAPPQEKKTVLTVEDAAEALGVHQQTIRGYIKSGKLRAYRIAGERAIRVFASDLYGLLEPLEPDAEEDDVEY
ncbi:MAG TPA: helix-turn-helix domain-containing protein [Longimicrobiales bacterium]|nr:helix-turn-helix domain-containing protein [Longimicrobiales bacterium]